MKKYLFFLPLAILSCAFTFCSMETNNNNNNNHDYTIRGHKVIINDTSALTLPYYQRDTNINKISFLSCDVNRATEKLEAMPYREVILDKLITKRAFKDREEAIYGDESLSYERKEKLANNENYHPKNLAKRSLEACAPVNDVLINTEFHPFMEAMHTAYAKHYPMTISPDMMWLLIAQGFANHVNQNAEAMRHHFVDFDGKKNLDIQRDEFVKGSKNNDWMGAFEEFGQKIEENTGKGLLDLVTGSFSTTGPIEKAAFQVTLMDAMKSYFDYSMTTSCGIPEITLEGSVEDWQALEKKAAALAQYDLDWWVDELTPILKEFTAAAAGKANKEFWESIYKWNQMGSGNPFISGWILKFFPYKKQGNTLVQAFNKENMAEEKAGDFRLTAGTDDLTSGLSQAPFIWNYYGTFFKMEFVAGFVGYRQDGKTLSLRPEISWAVIDLGQKADKKEIENYEKGGDEAYRKGKKAQ